MATPLNVSDIDFEAIKTNIKAVMRTDPTISDFDFEGAGISFLMNMLATSVHYNAIHANMSFSELHLETSRLRGNVVINAKKNGYVPRQKTSAKAILNISAMSKNGDLSLYVPSGVTFVASKDNVSYPFTTLSGVTLVDNAGVLSGDVVVNQGVLQSISFVHDINNPKRFVIPQLDVDTQELTVNVKAASGNTLRAFTLAQDITEVSPSSDVYFIQEVEGMKTEIYFGDGVLGAKLANGETVVIDYISTTGDAGNNCSVFELTSSSINGYSAPEITLTTVQKSYGGALEESIASVKHNAPKVYGTQNRMVSVPDFGAKLLERYGFIESLNVWGGEDNEPPQYGKVFISIKPNYADKLSPIVKADIITNYIKPLGVIGITPDIIDPEFLFVNITANVVFDETKTSDYAGSIEGAALAAVNGYFTSIIAFGSKFRGSVLSGVIDNSHVSIVSNQYTLKLGKKFVPSGSFATTYIINFVNPIVSGSIKSLDWSDGVGGTYSITEIAGGELIVLKNGVQDGNPVGSVNSVTGVVELRDFLPHITLNGEIVLQADAVSGDVQSIRNTLIRPDAILIGSARL